MAQNKQPWDWLHNPGRQEGRRSRKGCEPRGGISLAWRHTQTCTPHTRAHPHTHARTEHSTLTRAPAKSARHQLTRKHTRKGAHPDKPGRAPPAGTQAEGVPLPAARPGGPPRWQQVERWLSQPRRMQLGHATLRVRSSGHSVPPSRRPGHTALAPPLHGHRHPNAQSKRGQAPWPGSLPISASLRGQASPRTQGQWGISRPAPSPSCLPIPGEQPSRGCRRRTGGRGHPQEQRGLCQHPGQHRLGHGERGVAAARAGARPPMFACRASISRAPLPLGHLLFVVQGAAGASCMEGQAPGGQGLHEQPATCHALGWN